MEERAREIRTEFARKIGTSFSVWMDRLLKERERERVRETGRG
jgi:hypothetical protein